MSYEEILARAPRSTQAGDLAAAAAFVTVLSIAIEQGDSLTESQRTYLYRLRGKWQTRAEGGDARWNTSGSRPGRPPSPETGEPKRKRRTRPDPGEKTPLFQSLMKKYGKPRDVFGDDD